MREYVGILNTSARPELICLLEQFTEVLISKVRRPGCNIKTCPLVHKGVPDRGG